MCIDCYVRAASCLQLVNVTAARVSVSAAGSVGGLIAVLTSLKPSASILVDGGHFSAISAGKAGGLISVVNSLQGKLNVSGAAALLPSITSLVSLA